VVINNNITPTATLSGIPVSATGTTITGVTASNIQIGANPIGNGGIQIGGSSPPPANTLQVLNPSGSVIQATAGGQVRIKVP
jgi:hypothetical protein